MNSVHWAFLALTAWFIPIALVAYQSAGIPESIPQWYVGIGGMLGLYATGRQIVGSIAALKGKTTKVN